MMPLMKTFSRPEISGVESGAELDERRDAAVDAHRAARRLGDAGDELQRGALARAVAADDAEGRSLRHAERDIRQRRKRFARPQVAQDAPLEQRALERRELPAAVAPVDLRDVRELDRGRHYRLRKRVAQPVEQPVAGEEHTTDTTPSAAAISSGRSAA